jgi:ribulose 1,5-bisphosphate carboxylase large subunit-like protein
MGDDWRRVYVQMIDEIMLGVDFLTDDELNFVDSMYDLLQRRLALSDRQRAKLEEINTKTSQHLNQ